MPMSGCPVDSPTQVWIESSMQWFIDQFGARQLRRDVVTPTARFLPSDYRASAEQIEEMVLAACLRMEVERQFIDLRLFDGSKEKQEAARSGKKRTVGHFRMAGGKAVVSLDLSETADPVLLLAILVHELCHVRLLAEKRIKADRPDNERLTDLLTVFFGYGILSTNAAMRFDRRSGAWIVPRGEFDDRSLNAARNDGYNRLGYLKSAEFGYALSCYAWLRREQSPSCERYVTPGPLVTMRQGLSYLKAAGALGELPFQRLASKPVKVGNVSLRLTSGQQGLPQFGLGLPRASGQSQYPDPQNRPHGPTPPARI
jgi:hypothetical protein